MAPTPVVILGAKTAGLWLSGDAEVEGGQDGGSAGGRQHAGGMPTTVQQSWKRTIEAFGPPKGTSSSKSRFVSFHDCGRGTSVRFPFGLKMPRGKPAGIGPWLGSYYFYLTLKMVMNP